MEQTRDDWQYLSTIDSEGFKGVRETQSLGQQMLERYLSISASLYFHVNKFIHSQEKMAPMGLMPHLGSGTYSEAYQCPDGGRRTLAPTTYE